MEMGRRTPWRISLLAARKLGQRLPSPKLDAMPPWFLAGSQNLGRALVSSYVFFVKYLYIFSISQRFFLIWIGLISVLFVYVFIAFLCR